MHRPTYTCYPATSHQPQIIVGGAGGSFELELSGSLLGRYIMKNKDVKEDNNEYQHYLELDKGAY